MIISTRRFFSTVVFIVFLFLLNLSLAKAQTPTNTPVPTASPTPTPTKSVQNGSSLGVPDWQFDAEVTQVGKNAERARQLVYWVIKHPLIFKVPVIAKVWAAVRNVAYAMSLLVIIGLALHLVVSVRNIGPTFSGISLGLERLTLFRILFRLAAVLLFITFSYVLMRLLIESAEVLGRFFIERLGGEDLFNVVFAGSNIEQNYANFVGYRNVDPIEQEMANTSLFIVRLTSFTYNFLSVILILRQVILLFLLIISPILAIILPFVFIRNTGWVWIGEFFRWLFYGPLFALFISALAQIWKSGLPFAFDFTKARSGEVVYPTAINILYGGPAQLLTPTNSGNYIDTYAEYVIALIMLWAVIILPWLLLQIFRDYCCDILKENQNALLQILDKVRNLGLPPTSPFKPQPDATAGMAVNLPFRRQIFESKKTEEERIIERVRERNIENIRTQDLLKAVDLEVRSLTDIARSETNRNFYSNLQSVLNKIQNPASTSTSDEQRNFTTIKEALLSRASNGDKAAQNALYALSPRVAEIPHIISSLPSETLKEAVAKPNMPVVVPQITRISQISAPPVVSASLINMLSQRTQIPDDKVEKVLKNLPLITGTRIEKKKKLAQKAEISEEKVDELLNNLPAQIEAAAPPTVTIEEYEEVKSMWLNHYRKSEVPRTENIKSREDWLREDVKKLTNTMNLLISPSVKDRQQGMEQVANLLPFLLLGGFGDLETLTYIKAKLEAAKIIMNELEQVEKVKEQMKKEEEKEKVPLPDETEKPQAFEAKAQKEMPLPEEQSTNQTSNNVDNLKLDDKTNNNF